MSEFESVNINQTIHKIYFDLNTILNVFTPVGAFGEDINSKVLLTEAVIVGKIPDAYYNLEGLQQDDALEVME